MIKYQYGSYIYECDKCGKKLKLTLSNPGKYKTLKGITRVVSSLLTIKSDEKIKVYKHLECLCHKYNRLTRDKRVAIFSGDPIFELSDYTNESNICNEFARQVSCKLQSDYYK